MLDDCGVHYVGGPSVTRIDTGAVTLDDDVRIDTDLILAAIGITPCAELAESTELATDGGRIAVDDHMRTSAAGVFAVGDVAISHHPIAGRRSATEHWQDAIDQGEVAGAVAAGAEQVWDSIPGFWSTIGEHTLKYAAWGDGFDTAHLVERDDGFVVWYEAAGQVVGGLTYNSDDDYELAEKLIAGKRSAPR